VCCCEVETVVGIEVGIDVCETFVDASFDEVDRNSCSY
jgi:hypothetical protein